MPKSGLYIYIYIYIYIYMESNFAGAALIFIAIYVVQVIYRRHLNALTACSSLCTGHMRSAQDFVYTWNAIQPIPHYAFLSYTK